MSKLTLEELALKKNFLKQRQNLPLNLKIELTKRRIREFYEYFDGQVYVSFSGGKDSTVLLDIVRSLYPNVLAVFVDTGLEYPEVRQFVKSIENITINPIGIKISTYFNKSLMKKITPKTILVTKITFISPPHF